MFSSEEFLTASQVAGFFSRLAAKKSLFNDDDLEEEIECATQEATIEDLTNDHEVSRELLPGHPIMWDKYNICEMIVKFSRFNLKENRILSKSNLEQKT